WHHLLFSFDINGTVRSTQPSGGKPTMTTGCKAWLALDDKNYNGLSLQRRLRLPDGISAPLLPGMGTDVTGFGPSSSYNRFDFPALSAEENGLNKIIPQNVWIHGTKGNPKDGLAWYDSPTGISPGTGYIPAGNFNALAWAAPQWPLQGHGVAPGPWMPVLNPPRP